MKGIAGTAAFKNAERLEQAIVILGAALELHGKTSVTGRLLRKVITSLVVVLEETGLFRILQLGQQESLGRELERRQDGVVEGTVTESSRVSAEEAVLENAELQARMEQAMRDINVEGFEEE